MARRRSTIKGAASFRRLLRRLPDSARKELAQFLGEEVGPGLATFMRAVTPIRSGALKGAIAFKLAAKSLRLRIGVIGKADASRLFYGHILDVGRRAQRVRVTRRNRGSGFSSKTLAKKGGAPMSSYVLNVKPLKALRLEYRTRLDFRDAYLPKYRKLMDAILLDAARGAGND